MKKPIAIVLLAVLLPACGDEGDTIIQGGPTPPPSGSLLMSTQNGLLLVVQPGTPPTILSAVGLVGVSGSGGSTVVRGLEHDVLDGVLYGFVDGNAYRIDPLTGVCIQIATFGLSEGTAFDPVQGWMRIAGISDENAHIIAWDGTAIPDVDLEYAPGDPNFGLNPAIAEIAFTHQVAGATTTTLYGIDRTHDVLVTIAPTHGEMTTVGSTVVHGVWTPFDIAASGTAYVVDSNNLYTIDLATGALTLLGAIPTTDVVSGMAVVP